MLKPQIVKTLPNVENFLRHCQRKDFNNALMCLGKAHELDPEDKHLASQYGLCLARAGRRRCPA